MVAMRQNPHIIPCVACGQFELDWLVECALPFRCASCRECRLVERFSAFFRIARSGHRISITDVGTIMTSILWFVYDRPQLLQRRLTMRWFLEGGPSKPSEFWRTSRLILLRELMEGTLCTSWRQRGRYYRTTSGSNTDMDFVDAVLEFLL